MQFSKNVHYWEHHCFDEEMIKNNSIEIRKKKKKKNLNRCLDNGYVTRACRQYPYQVGKTTRLRLQDVAAILEAKE